jgi:hypothetical protein
LNGIRKICAVADCSEPVAGPRSFYCSRECMNAMRRHKSGKQPRLPELQRFWNAVDRRADNECWEWTRARDENGYGRISIGGRQGGMVLAHRHSYELANGPIPDGLDVLHSCDNPPCVNPGHLRAGTAKDNMEDVSIRERSNTRKLTAADVASIKAAYRGGATQLDLARKFGVCSSNVSYICRGVTWRHVA